MSKIDPEFKKKWIEALRSGEYKQRRRSLTDCSPYRSVEYPTEFCCIGVGAHVKNSERDWCRYDTEDASIDIGLDHKSAEMLIVMNDDDCKSFPQIADWIEENL